MLGNLFSRRQRWLRDLPARAALKLFNRPRIRSILDQRYSTALSVHQSALPRLTGADALIASALENSGICVTTLEALDLDGGGVAVSQASALADDFTTEARALSAKGNAFIIVPPEWVAAHPAIYHLGLQDRLLDIAESYLGLPPAYDGVAINYTVADGGREISTRKWHRDWEDRRMLKVAIYLHDVDETGGPFQMIQRYDTTQNDQGGFNYELADDATLKQLLGANFDKDIVSCCGPAGTVIFTDTARFFHRGKPTTARDRTALFYSYFADPPRHPFFCERTGLRRSDIARLTQGLPARQRKAALWRNRVSPILRIIPPATL